MTHTLDELAQRLVALEPFLRACGNEDDQMAVALHMQTLGGLSPYALSVLHQLTEPLS
jgi:hypothetical protein